MYNYNKKRKKYLKYLLKRENSNILMRKNRLTQDVANYIAAAFDAKAQVVVLKKKASLIFIGTYKNIEVIHNIGKLCQCGYLGVYKGDRA